jgi:hypothetical protein
METAINAISENVFDNILPTFGNPRVHIPVWNDSQKMFIFEEYESCGGNLYYRGIRFCERVAIVENIGLYHNWTYIDGIELYAFNGKKPELIQKCDYENTFRSEEFIRKESESMVKHYLAGALKAQKIIVPDEQLDSKAKEIVNGCYKSFLDPNFNTCLTQIIPVIENQ